MSEGMVRRPRASERRVKTETHIEVFLETLSIRDPASGRTIKVMPEWDSETGKASPYKFCFMGQDGYYYYFDVRELPNWTEFSRPHPLYRDPKTLKKQWEAQQGIIDDLMSFVGVRMTLTYSNWLATHRDPEWDEYHRARDSHVESKIVEVANEGLLDLSR